MNSGSNNKVTKKSLMMIPKGQLDEVQKTQRPKENGQKKTDRRKNNHLQNIAHKAKDGVTRTQI